ncbi:hypothetical protein QR680_005339 [Steinernema hermaphroditum]|uniref:NTR domain-containing protein n=1 Tax=Steinernema hermaphroditum TaxID=289476 RepID=A0AA39HRN3_9BILA|nr:hypothetical protein QR680_005339 [Steinernema hermaphroditum]
MKRAAVLLFVVIGIAFACRCRLPTPKEAFCGSDWVGVFKVLQKNTIPDSQQISYTVQVVNAFRAVYAVPTIGSTNLLFTQYTSAACGIEGLENGKQYLLAGSATEGLQMNSCTQFEWSLDWNEVPDDVKTALQNGTYYPCN